MSRIKLFCFPYAGGSASIYSKWTRFLSPQVELSPIELKGRGHRMQEVLYGTVEEMVRDVLRIVEKDIHDHSYALFGHSMGCIIAYELAQKIRKLGYNQPKHIFFSGHGAPHVRRDDKKKYHLMDSIEFREKVIELGGTPPEFFDHPELLRLFLPLLRNDFRLAEEERADDGILPLDTDITVFLGKEDDLTPEQCDGWKLHTSKACYIHNFDGGHFFLHDEVQKITKLINGKLRKYVNTDPNHFQITE